MEDVVFIIQWNAMDFLTKKKRSRGEFCFGFLSLFFIENNLGIHSRKYYKKKEEDTPPINLIGFDE